MPIASTPTIAAHIPAESGYNPDGGAQGDLQILSSPKPENGNFATLAAALRAAKDHTKTFDTATGIFQAADGAFQIGTAVRYSPEDGPGELALSPSLAAKVVFDDPALMALVSYDSIALRK